MNVLSSARIILSVSVIVLALLQLTGVWINAIHVFEPLVGVLMLIQAAQNWEKRKGVAYFSICGHVHLCGGNCYLSALSA